MAGRACPSRQLEPRVSLGCVILNRQIQTYSQNAPKSSANRRFASFKSCSASVCSSYEVRATSASVASSAATAFALKPIMKESLPPGTSASSFASAQTARRRSASRVPHSDTERHPEKNASSQLARGVSSRPQNRHGRGRSSRPRE